jgi:hypothetical protein
MIVRPSLLCLCTCMALAHADTLPLPPEQCSAMRTAGVLGSAAPLGCERLVRVSFRHVDFDGATRTGELVVMDALAPQVAAVFDALYRRRFPIARARPLENYRGDDLASMADNNTSAFNARPITGGSRWSLHAYGVAIDLNPLQNPYLSFDASGSAQVLPPAAAATSVNRSETRPGKPARTGLAEAVVDLFAEHGFLGWGGDWNTPIDYQHFEPGSRRLVERMAGATPAEAHRLFEARVAAYNACIAQTAARPSRRAHCVEHVTRNE